MTALLDTLRFSLWAIHLHRATRMPPERVRELQERRLRRLLRDAVDHSPFYRRRYRGIDVETCPLNQLPSTTKPELMDHFDEVVTDRRLRRAELERFIDNPANANQLFMDRYAVSHSSGSQGQPLIIVKDQLGLDLLFAFQMTRGNVDFGLGLMQTMFRFFRPARLAVVSSKRGFVPSASAWQHAPPALHHYARLVFMGSADSDLVAKLNRFQPTMLAGYPSGLESLALQAADLRLAGLRQVTCNSENLTEQTRARLSKAFRAPVLDNYATGECIFLSTGCHAGRGVHVNADWAILEVVDEAGRPVPFGEPGAKVLITNLANVVQPFIRYEVGDRVVRAEGPCPCGNRLPRLARIEGRSADVFWLHLRSGARPLSNVTFKNALDALHEVREWQAVQQGPRRILIRLEPLPGQCLDPRRVSQLLDGVLDSVAMRGELDLTWEVAPRLCPDPVTGKFRRFIGMAHPHGQPAHVARSA